MSEQTLRTFTLVAVAASMVAGATSIVGACGKSGMDERSEAADDSRSTSDEKDDSGEHSDSEASADRKQKEDDESADGAEGGSGEAKSSAEASAEAESESESPENLPLEATGPVAVIDGEEISAETYNELVAKRFGNRKRKIPSPMARSLKSKMLTKLIDQTLLERELEKAEIRATDDEVREALQDFKERFPNDRAYENFLKYRDTTEAELENNLKKDVRLRKLLREREGIDVTTSEARKYYDEHIAEYREPEKVKARHILIKVGPDASAEEKQEAKSKAEQLLGKARNEGTDFAELAREHSDGPSAKKGGDLGFFSRDRMVDAFSDKVFSMEEGEIAGPVETNFGYHVIKKEKHEAAHTKSFESVEDDIVSKLEKKKFKKALDELTTELRERADISKHPENIEVRSENTRDAPSRLKGGRKLKLKKHPKLKGK